MKQIRKAAAWIFALWSVAAFMSSAAGAEGARKLQVVASFLPLYCFTANVAGDHANVLGLVPAGVSPHDYQFAPQDVHKLQGADLLLLNGLGLEPWKERLLKNVTPRKVVAVSDNLETGLIKSEFGGVNPHIWLDPRLAMHCVSNIVTALSDMDPANAEAYAANAASYLERLRELDRNIATALQPIAGAALITYHDFLPYFARRYNLTIAGVVEPVPEINPTAQHLAALRKTARTQNVKALLVEAQSRPRLAERLGREMKIPLVALNIMETGRLTSSAYEDGMRENLEALQRALR